jgi:hypothetical protein
MEPASGEQKKRPARYGDPMEARGSQKRDFANAPNENRSRRRRGGAKKKLIAA